MTIYFYNPEPLNIDAIRIMGLSAKETDNPIGFFGTGLKYAIAVLLRNSHEIKITSGGTLYTFTTQIGNFRGHEFNRIIMNGELLGFTTELGKNWSVDNAFRELHSNALDEKGGSSDQRPDSTNGTIIEVTGLGISESFRRRDRIFLTETPLKTFGNVSLYESRGGFEPSAVYYKGVLVAELSLPTAYRYNFLRNLQLTEDRTINYSDMLRELKAAALSDIDDEKILTHILLASTGSVEAALYYSPYDKPSKTFLKVVGENSENASLNQTALSLWQKTVKQLIYKPIPFTPSEQLLFKEKIEPTLRALGCPAKLDDYIKVKNLGPNHYGRFHKGLMMVDQKCVDHGIEMFTHALYEEWVHMTTGYGDETRELQTFLFLKLIDHAQQKAKRAKS